jgi:hypothetical protein
MSGRAHDGRQRDRVGIGQRQRPHWRLWTYVRDDRHFAGRDPLATAFFYSPIAAPSTRGSFSATSAFGRSLESKDIWFGVDRRLGSVTDRRPARISHSL